MNMMAQLAAVHKNSTSSDVYAIIYIYTLWISGTGTVPRAEPHALLKMLQINL